MDNRSKFIYADIPEVQNKPQEIWLWTYGTRRDLKRHGISFVEGNMYWFWTKTGNSDDISIFSAKVRQSENPGLWKAKIDYSTYETFSESEFANEYTKEEIIGGWSQIVLTIDGENFSDFKGFVKEFSINIFGDEKTWNGNADALNDCLRGGFGAPEEPYTILWLNSKKSLNDLDHKAMHDWLLAGMGRVHPSNMELWEKRIELAERNKGETLFAFILEIIIPHENITIVLE